ncbi:MAG: TraR/DksA C4-type zinc finger protein [Planctomycetota bacterium]|nr:TraR/DksA C4-type zinc finger protein [Planctomycetota bacterium]
MTTLLRVTCSACQWSNSIDTENQSAWLSRARLLRDTSTVDADLVCELFLGSISKLKCPLCQQSAIYARRIDSDDLETSDDESWGMARRCEVCKQPIAAERIEIFPDTRLCTKCQQTDDRGELPVAREYCPRCGSVMQLRQSTGGGLTRYLMTCLSCRR